MPDSHQPDASKPLTWSARRINALASALGARRYLEIGVSQGATFHAVNIPDRVAVDAKFPFDYAKFANNHTSFHEITSDRYFESLPPDVTFDIFFIDGLHTFEQTLRDFCNAVVHSNPKTVWLLDDTRPSDVFSTMPDMARTYHFRQMTGSKDRSWHGDVFKLVYYIHDFMPTLNYRTLIGGGNPQTLIWRSNRGWRAPLFNNLEAISRMTYFDMCDHIAVLRACPEDQAIKQCVDELTGVPGPA